MEAESERIYSDMSNASDPFFAFVENMLAIAQRVQSRGVRIYALDFNAAGFGSWAVVAGNDRERFRFEWEGRVLEFTISEIIRINNLPEWRTLRSINLFSSQALSTSEDFLHEKFSPVRGV